MPGKTYAEKIGISNTTNSPMNVSLYPASATNVKGVFQPIEKILPNGVASWTTVEPKFAKLPAHTEMIATVTIKVPVDAISSQQYGVIWAATNTYPNSNAIGGISRVGIRMYDQVGDTTPGDTSSPAPSATSTTSTATGNTSWLAGHLVEIEWVGISLLFLLVIIIGAISVRRERKRAEKRRRKQKE